jgi:hypothetical protein
VFGLAAAAPRPIPGGFDLNFNPVPRDPFVHVLPPSVGFEMSTITDFDGVIAASETQGTANDGAYTFDCDMRLMRGVYVGLDGRLHEGAFGFIWIDLYPPGAVGDPTQQVHDFEPGIARSGLFWTIPAARSAIDVSPGSGRARLHAEHVPVTDFHNLFIAVGLSEPPPLPVPSHVSFDVRWSGSGDRRVLRDETFGFTGHYATSSATISFTASNDGGEVVYHSDAAGQSNVGQPGVGHERNGVFFH